MKKGVFLLLATAQISVLGCQPRERVQSQGPVSVQNEDSEAPNNASIFKSSESLVQEARSRLLNLLSKNSVELQKRLVTLKPKIDVELLTRAASRVEVQSLVRTAAGPGRNIELSELDLHDAMLNILQESLVAFDYDQKRGYGTSLYILQNLLGVDLQSLTVELRQRKAFGPNLERCGEVTSPNCTELREALRQGKEGVLAVLELQKDDDLSTYSLLYKSGERWNLLLETGETVSANCQTSGVSLLCESVLEGDIVLSVEVGSSAGFATLKRQTSSSQPKARPLEWISAKYWLFRF